MDRAAALALLERHQPYRLLFLLRVVRCAACRQRWPCAHYMDARSSLLSASRLDVAATLRRNAPPWQTNAEGASRRCRCDAPRPSCP